MEESAPTENQKYGLDDYITSLPYLPSVIDITATNWRKPIPEMEQLLVSIRSGVYDEVVFWTVDRTGRRHEWDVNFWALCRKHGVLLRFIADGCGLIVPMMTLSSTIGQSVRNVNVGRCGNVSALVMTERKVSGFDAMRRSIIVAGISLASWKGNKVKRRRTKLWRWLVHRASAKGLQFINPVGGGKNKGNIRGQDHATYPRNPKIARSQNEQESNRKDPSDCVSHGCQGNRERGVETVSRTKFLVFLLGWTNLNDPSP